MYTHVQGFIFQNGLMRQWELKSSISLDSEVDGLETQESFDSFVTMEEEEGHLMSFGLFISPLFS